MKSKTTRKILSLLLGGALIMTALIGSLRPSVKEIRSKVDGRAEMYPTKDLLSLYDRDTDPSDFESDASRIPEGDLGTWSVSTSINNVNEISSHYDELDLYFNRNTRECTGVYTITTLYYGNEEKNTEEKYKVTYDENGIKLVDEVNDPALKERIENLPILAQILDLSNNKLDTLKIKAPYYNPSQPQYGMQYYLDEENIEALRKAYPELTIKDDMYLNLYGAGSSNMPIIASMGPADGFTTAVYQTPTDRIPK